MKFLSFLYILIVQAVCFGQSTANQNINYETISTNDGLSSRKVKRVYQDNSGMIWIKTENALHRYNGYALEDMHKHLNVRINETLKTETILWEDSLSNIWLKDGNELVRFNINTEQFERFKFAKHDSDYGNAIVFVSVDHDGKLLVKPAHMNLMKYVEDNFIELADTDLSIFNESDDYYHVQLFADRDENYILKASKHKTYILSKDFKVREWFTMDHFLPQSIYPDMGFTVFRDKAGDLYAQAYYNQFFKWNFEQGLFIKPVICDTLHPSSQIRYIGNNGHFFIGGTNEVWDYNPYTGKAELLISEKEFGKNFKAHDIVKDKAGTIWVSSNFGVIKIFPESSKFTKLNIDSPSGLDHPNSVRAIYPFRDNELLISVKNFNYIYNPKTEEYKFLETPRNDMWRVVKGGENHWAVRRGSTGIFKWNSKAKVFENIPSPYPSNLLMEIEYHQGKLWMGESKFLIRYDIKEGTWERHTWRHGRLNHLYVNNDNSLFLACDGGLVEIDTNFNELRLINEETEPALSTNHLQHIYIDSDSSIWLSTRGGGVNVIDNTFKSVDVIDTRDGLPHNIVYAVIPFSGLLWIPTDNGLSVYDQDKNFIQTYTIEDGISHNEFNYPSHCLHHDRLYLGTLDGVTVVESPFETGVNPELPVFFTSISTYNRKTKQTDYHNLNLLSPEILDIKPHDNNLRVEFSLASYWQSHRNNYYYRIKGFEPEWKIVPNKNSLLIGNLPAGKYDLEIKAYNYAGLSNSHILSLPLRVHKKFTQSYLFSALISGILALLFFVIYKFRMNQYKRLAKVRQDIAVNLHDEVGSMLTGIAIESDLINADVYNETEAKSKLDQIAMKSRDASSAMSDIVWSFDSRKDKVKNLVDRMRQHLINMLKPSNIDYQFNISQMDYNSVLHPEVRQNVYLIFKESIHNIVKHSDASSVNIELKYDRGVLKLLIEDNGNNKHSSSVSSGQGIQNMKMRADKINGKLIIDDTNGYKVQLIV